MKRSALAFLAGVSVCLLVAAAAANRRPLFQAFLASNLDGNQLSVTNLSSIYASGYFVATNPLALWPTNAATPGGAWIGNSNSVVYLLTSTPASVAWAATNKLGP